MLSAERTLLPPSIFTATWSGFAAGKLRFQGLCFRPHSQPVAAGIPLTSLFSSITEAANPGPLEGLGGLCAAQRSPREGDCGAEIQCPGMNPGTESPPRGRDTVCSFPGNTVCAEGIAPSAGPLVMGDSIPRTQQWKNWTWEPPHETLLSGCPLPTSPLGGTQPTINTGTKLAQGWGKFAYIFKLMSANHGILAQFLIHSVAVSSLRRPKRKEGHLYSRP